MRPLAGALVTRSCGARVPTESRFDLESAGSASGYQLEKALQRTAPHWLGSLSRPAWRFRLRPQTARGHLPGRVVVAESPRSLQ